MEIDYCPTVALNYNIFPSAVATNNGVSIRSFYPITN